MTRSRSTTLLVFALVLLVALSSWLLGNSSVATPARAATETPPVDRAREGVLVSATGEVLGVPDMLRADFGVRTSATTVDEALNLANAAMTQMQDALVDGGVTRADLRRNAFADAQAKAELYAEQAGRTLGQVMSVTEEVPSNGFTTFASGAAEAMPVPLDVPLQPGREQLAVTVTVEWSFR